VADAVAVGFGETGLGAGDTEDGTGVGVGVGLVVDGDGLGVGEGDRLGVGLGDFLGDGLGVGSGSKGPAGNFAESWFGTCVGWGVATALKTLSAEGEGVFSGVGLILWKRNIPPPKTVRTSAPISPAVTCSPLTKKVFCLTGSMSSYFTTLN
jgi:hypothetical protein